MQRLPARPVTRGKRSRVDPSMTTDPIDDTAAYEAAPPATRAPAPVEASPEAPADAIVARALTKTYGRTDAPRPALDRIDLTVPRGAFFGLLGPNGAGKSTFINILAGLVNKSAGSAAIWGHDIDRATRRARASIGVVPQELNIDAFFTPREALEFQAGLYGVRRRDRRTDAILAAVRLTDMADVYSRALSGGMRRRLLVAKAMVHRPPVLARISHTRHGLRGPRLPWPADRVGKPRSSIKAHRASGLTHPVGGPWESLGRPLGRVQAAARGVAGLNRSFRLRFLTRSWRAAAWTRRRPWRPMGRP